MKIFVGIFACLSLAVFCNAADTFWYYLPTTTTTRGPIVHPDFVNWCDPKLIGSNGRNLACKNPGSFASTCVKPRMIEMTDVLRDEILENHNTFKNQVAGGSFPLVTLPTGARMQTLEYNHQLERLAELNCRTCNFAHDFYDQIRLPQFWSVGQNLGMFWLAQPQESIEASFLFKNRLDDWANELILLKPEVLSWPAIKTDPLALKYGHAAIMSMDGVHQVGCSACQFEIKSSFGPANASYVVCNYSGYIGGPGNLWELGEPIKACVKGANPKYPNLCSSDENKTN